MLEVRQNLSRWSRVHKLGVPRRPGCAGWAGFERGAERPPQPAVAASGGRMRFVRAWVNGKLLEDPAGPAVAVSDHGLTVGDGVFEAIKAVNGQPFALTLHLERLRTSAEGLGLPDP